MFDKAQPLWLPKGSVRAILALLIVVPFLVLALTSGIKITGDQFVSIIMVVLTAYFIGKAYAPADK